MFFLNFLVFTNLFLLPFFFHPFNISRHLIHIGHEPFQPETLPVNSYEFYLYNILENPKSYISIYPFIKQRNLFQRIYNYLFPSQRNLSRKVFYPNLIRYTYMYIIDHDISLFLNSFLTMYISYFLLTYISLLVHVYRISMNKTKRKSMNEIRDCAKQWIESSYVRWISHALFWKFLAVVISHVFYVMAIKITMQRLFISYGHYQLNDKSIYSSWNLYKNLNLILKYERWNGIFSGICTRMIYELDDLKSIFISLGITILPRLLWWPFRTIFLRSTLQSYFHASSTEFYFLHCICEQILRCFSIYLQFFARLTTIEIVNQMHDHPNLNKYPLLSLLRHHHHHHLKQPCSFLLSINRIDAKLITNGLSFFLRQAN